MGKTLADMVSRDFSKVKVKKTIVKVPKLRARKKFNKPKKHANIPVSSIVNILIKAAVEKAKKERKEKKTAEEEKSYRILEDGREFVVNGGYGTASKSYGSPPHVSYVDYGKLFGYLGKLKSQSAYENMDNPLGFLNKSSESGSFVLADKESMDKIGRFDKYIRNPDMAMQTMALSLVPVAGLSSAEWEEVKMLMKLDPVMYALKSKIS